MEIKNMNSIQRRMYIEYGNRKDEEYKKQLLEKDNIITQKDDKIRELDHICEVVQQKLYSWFEGDARRILIWQNPNLDCYSRTIGYNIRITDYEYNMMITNETFRREFLEYHIRKFIRDVDKNFK